MRLGTQLVIVGISVFSVLGYLGKLHWTWELANHFRVQYLLGATLGLVLFLIMKSWRWSLIAVIVVTLNAFHVLPWFFLAPAKVAGYRLKLLQANVKYSNTQYETLIAYVKEEAPDIATFQEVNKTWAEKLALLNESFSYAKVEAEELGSGLALYSKIKLESAERDDRTLSASRSWLRPEPLLLSFSV